MVEHLQTLAGQYPRYGYRRILIFMERAGHRMSADRLYRLWRQARLQVPTNSGPPARDRKADRMPQVPRSYRLRIVVWR